MTAYREYLIDRLVHLYGLENPIVVDFCRYCENWANSETNDDLLTLYVKTHEGCFMVEED